MSDEHDNLSRRELLRGRFLAGFLDTLADHVPLGRATDDPQRRDVQPSETTPSHRKCFPILRPPGAVNEESFLENCTRCDACIEACPHDAIVHAPVRFRQAAGTPMINALTSPCRMCNDFPCIAACEPKVLRMDLPKAIGTARIDMQTCLAYQNSFCTVCSEQCPVQGAIELTNGKPRIVEQKCTGCGICQHVCPAPQNAVMLMPLRERPFAPLDETPQGDAA